MTKGLYLGVVLLALALPACTKADTFTFSISGSPQQISVTSFSLGVSVGPGPGMHKTGILSIVTPLPDPLGAVLSSDFHGRTEIPSVTIDAYKDINGVSTLQGILEFDKDFVTAIGFSGLGGQISETLKFSYVSEKVTIVGSGPPPPGFPEPSTLILIGSGIGALCALRKKQPA